MATVVIAIIFIGIFFLFMSVRLIFVKDGKFRGTCASQSPYLNKEGESCGMCGKKVDPGESCQNKGTLTSFIRSLKISN
ncbi:hypothetical protein ACFLU5_08575 [Bacteroidota bacterium]